MARPRTVVRGNQTDSFEDFFRREYRSVLGLAVALSGDRWAAEDLTQEAFAAAERKWARVGSLDRPQAWVRRIVANKSVSDDWTRQVWRRDLRFGDLLTSVDVTVRDIAISGHH